MVKDITEAQDESMNINVTEYENVINIYTLHFKKVSLIWLSVVSKKNIHHYLKGH